MSQNDISITQTKDTIVFPTIGLGVMTWNFVSFLVNSTQEVTLIIQEPPLPPFGLTLLGNFVKVPPLAPANNIGNLWFSYIPPLDAKVGDTFTQFVTIKCAENDQTFSVSLFAAVANVPFLSTMLVLDKSGSMGLAAGDSGITRIEALKQASSAFVTLIPTDNELGIVSFSHEAQKETDFVPITTEEGKQQIIDLLQNFSIIPSGSTAIGKGVTLGKQLLDDANLVEKNFIGSLLVFTDGIENVQPFVDTIIDSINYHTYAVGLGTAQQVSIDSLTKLTTATGGYCLLTGNLTPDTEGFFRLTKYFVQVLMDITGQDVATDPDGIILPGQLIRIPWTVSDADVKNEIVLLTDVPTVRLEIETPNGIVINQNGPGVSFGRGPNLRYCRISLPLPTPQGSAHEGTWHALLRIDPELLKEERLTNEDSRFTLGRPLTPGVRYSLSVHTRSNLRLKAQVNQRSFLPGESFNIRVGLTEYGVPVEGRAATTARVRRPDGTSTTVSLVESEPGISEANVPMIIPGVYQVHISSSGRTFSGHPFTREKILTAGVLLGGKHELPSTGDLDRCCWYSRYLFWLVLLLTLFVVIFGILFWVFAR